MRDPGELVEFLQRVIKFKCDERWFRSFQTDARDLLDQLPRCLVVGCGQPATRDGAWCDQHYDANHIWP